MKNQRRLRPHRAILWLLVGVSLTAQNSFGAETSNTRRETNRLVVGHQMLALPRYGSGVPEAEHVREEIEQWKDLGLDGVMLFDILPFKDTARQYYRVGAREGFQFAISTSVVGDNIDLYVDILTELAREPYVAGQLRVDDRYYLSDYASNPRIQELAERIEAVTGPVLLEPHIVPRTFFGPATLAEWKAGQRAGSDPSLWRLLLNHPEWTRIDGLAAFDFAPSLQGQADMIRWIWEAARERGKTARGNIVAAYKGYAHKGNPMVFEPWGYSRLLACWRAAIESGIPHVEFLTLNDMSESSYFNSWAKDDPPIMIEHWNTGDNAAILDHSGFRNFSKRYVQWFKSGVEPAITKDEFYYAYRLHPRNAPPYFELSKEQQATLQHWIPSGQPAERIYRKEPIPGSDQDKVGIEWRRFSDGIHAAVRLTAPAEIWINGTKIAELPAGEHLVTRPGAISEGEGSLGYPMHTFGPEDFGFPRFEIRRNGHAVMSHTGELEITPYPVPGCWNIFARQAPASAWKNNSPQE